MQRYRYVVTVACDTPEQAATVMGSRLGYDEEIDEADGGPFDYEITYSRAPAISEAAR